MKKDTVEALLAWYNKNKRILPWRKNNNPYYIWVSEIMLQQTRIEAVKRYFERFIKELPDIYHLSQVEDDKLMKLWEGLGYYNRARNLKKAANQIMVEFDGSMPGCYDQLITLAGIGPYTAGAIASICYNEPVPAVDGNVLRVFMRLDGSYEDISSLKVKKNLEDRIQKIITKEMAGDFNQAVMELGETICIPNGKPVCALCPIVRRCKAYKKKIQTELPVKIPKKPRKREEKTVFLLQCAGKLAVAKRPDTGLLAGMWEFPNVESIIPENQVAEYLEHFGIIVHTIERTEKKKHIFTHKEWDMLGYYVICEEIPKQTVFQWVSREQIEKEFAVPTAMAQFLKSK